MTYGNRLWLRLGKRLRRLCANLRQLGQAWRENPGPPALFEDEPAPWDILPHENVERVVLERANFTAYPWDTQRASRHIAPRLACCLCGCPASRQDAQEHAYCHACARDRGRVHQCDI